MAEVKAQATLSSKDVEAAQGNRAEVVSTAHNMLLADLLSIDKNIAWLDGMAFDQLIVRVQEDCVLAIVKAFKGRQAYIAFVASTSYAEALETTSEFAAKGVLTWKLDKYPSKRVKAL